LIIFVVVAPSIGEFGPPEAAYPREERASFIFPLA